MPDRPEQKPPAPSPHDPRPAPTPSTTPPVATVEPAPLPPFGLIYGKADADFDDIEETGPYPSQNEARSMIDHGKADRLGGWSIVAEWVKSDGKHIATGKGTVVETGQTTAPPTEPTAKKKPV
jgi:hypothetical protein